jgi:hypothetical protein
MTKVIIVISGGCLLSVFSSESIEYNLIDYDNIDGGDEVSEDFISQYKIMDEEAMQKFIDKVKEMASIKVPKDDSEGH